jgi:hypothetical protein
MTLQMMIIHYTDEHLIPLEGVDDVSLTRDLLIEEFSKIYKFKDNELRGGKYEEQSKFVKPIVMVKRGSTLPTDDMTKRNDAIALWGSNGSDPISLYEDLNDPNPEIRAKRLFLWQQAPQILFPELAQAMSGQGSGSSQEQYTEGMIKDTEAIQGGQDPGINRELQDPQQAILHTNAHSAYMDSDEFTQLDDTIKRLYIDHIKAEIAFINEQKAEINSKIGEFKNQYSSLPNKETELNRLKRFNSLYEKFYLSLIEKQIEYQISKAGTVPEFTILSNAYADENPISPNKQKIYLGFIIISFLPTILFVLYQYLFNNVIFSRKNLEKKLTLVCMMMMLTPLFKMQ